MNQYNDFLFSGEKWGFHPTLAWIIPSILWIITVWTFFWKGYAIWTAIKNDQKRWFVVFLLVNTVGILEIVYIFKIAKKSWADVKKVLQQKVSSIK